MRYYPEFALQSAFKFCVIIFRYFSHWSLKSSVHIYSSCLPFFLSSLIWWIKKSYLYYFNEWKDDTSIVLHKASRRKRYMPLAIKPITFLYKYSHCGQVDCNWQSNYKSAYYILRRLSTWYAPSDYTDVNNGKLQHSRKKCILPHASITLKLVVKMESGTLSKCKFFLQISRI